MKVLVIGSGGREHTLTWKIHQSKLVSKIYCAPGNAGMGQIAECVSIKADDVSGLLSFAKKHAVDLTVVGPEAPLVSGIVDAFETEGLLIFGPNKQAAQLEGSKVFSKRMMAKYGVPTAPFKVFNESAKAKEYIMTIDPPFVIKADGLAAGKGVVIVTSTEQGVRVITDIVDNKMFGDAGNEVLIEEFITGEELSILVFTDGDHILPLASSQDHKRAYDHDEGPNTGGMGAYSPCPLVAHDDLQAIVDKTVRPIIEGLKKEGITYKGLLYAGLMISKAGPTVLEYNVRFGDPETQAILPRLKDDIVPLLKNVAQGKLLPKRLAWDCRSCVTVVIASGGYPEAYDKGYVITGLDKAHQYQDVIVFHAGTQANESGAIVTRGGRVLGVSALGDSLKKAQERVYQAVKEIEFEKAFYRNDIANKALQHLPI